MQNLCWRLAVCLPVLLVWASVGVAADYHVRPGDILTVEVLEDQSLNGSVLVAPDGRISVPLAGSLAAQGRTVDEVRHALSAALASNFAVAPTVHVGLASLAEPAEPPAPAQRKVYIMGEVNTPGVVEVSPGTTLLQVLSLAGGFSDFAAVKRIQLRRPPRDGNRERIWKINYEAILNGRSAAAISRVQEGDVIVVPTRRLFE